MGSASARLRQKDRDVHARGPPGGYLQAQGDRLAADDRAFTEKSRGRRARGAFEWRSGRQETPSPAPVVAYAVDVDAALLRGTYGDMEGELLLGLGLGDRGVPPDLPRRSLLDFASSAVTVPTNMPAREFLLVGGVVRTV